DNASKRPRRSSRGSAKTSTARTLEIDTDNRETRTKASHDRVKVSSGTASEVPPSNVSDPNIVASPSKVNSSTCFSIN
ncbi:hypothetical protein A2U01_0059436, partial [Trifolium medium]|nr:hypothetical protein [Trifolium medium]